MTDARDGAARLALILALVPACSSDTEKPAQSSTPPAAAAVGLTKSDTGWVLHTEDFSLAPGQEKFLCYAVTTPEDMAIGRFSSDAHPFIHHFLFSTALVKEPEGMTECDVLFKPTWSPMFIATTATADITMPGGAAKLIDKQTQLVLQLHLLNGSAKAVTGSAEVRMEASHLTNPEPVGIFAFGTTNIHLPPQQLTTIEGLCTVNTETRFFAMLPHMHYLGTRLEIDLGPDDDHLTSAFVSDPYDFNNQQILPFDKTIAAGTHSRIRCTYDNTRSQTISFGESTRTEMCFGVGFMVGSKGPRGCLAKLDVPDGGVPRAPDAGVCGATEYAGGIGRPCTPGGNECDAGGEAGAPSGLFCTANAPGVDAGRASGVCVKIGCSDSSECGGATCCAFAGGGGLVNMCVPEACRDPSCLPR